MNYRLGHPDFLIEVGTSSLGFGTGEEEESAASGLYSQSANQMGGQVTSQGYDLTSNKLSGYDPTTYRSWGPDWDKRDWEQHPPTTDAEYDSWFEWYSKNFGDIYRVMELLGGVNSISGLSGMGGFPTLDELDMIFYFNMILYPLLYPPTGPYTDPTPLPWWDYTPVRPGEQPLSDPPAGDDGGDDGGGYQYPGTIEDEERPWMNNRPN